MEYCSSSISDITPIWSTMIFGLAVTDDETYKFPLFISGGSTALKPSYIKFRMPNSKVDSWHYGNKYDLTIKPLSLNNCNILYTTKDNYTDLTNSLVLGPDGEWKYIYVYEQSQDRSVDPYTTGGNPPDPPNPQYSISSGIIYKNQTKKSTILPTATNEQQSFKTYDKTKDMNRMVSVHILANSESEKEETGIYGTVPNIYSMTDINEYGIMDRDGSRYIVVPNGWVDRIPFHYNLVYKVGGDDMDKIVTDYYTSIRQYLFTQVLVIKVGER